MAKPGDEYTDGNGGRIFFRETAGSTAGELLEVEAVYRPHSQPPPLHYHPYQDEHFEVMEGVFAAQVGGQMREYGAGHEFQIPAGTLHRMHNASDGPGRLIWQTRPALTTEVFFETVWGLAQDGRANRGGIAEFLQSIAIGREHRDVFRLASPPDIVQRILFALIGPVGSLAGYQGRYPEYSGDNG